MNRITVYVVNLSTKKVKRKYWYFQWVDPVTKKRKSQSSKCKTRREAERAAKGFEERLNSRLPTGDGTISWEDFVSVYTEEHLESLESSSLKRVLSIFSVFSKVVSPAQLSSITTPVLSKYAKSLRGEPWLREESTIATHLTRLSTALGWAVEQGYIRSVPKSPRVTRSRTSRAKGRPLTDDEFAKFLFAIPRTVGDECGPSWSRLLIGLWLSGLRLDEALVLSWDYGSPLWLDTTQKRPLLGITIEGEKGKRDRLMPLTPDFGQWVLDLTPEHRRAGLVFPLEKKRHRSVTNMDHVSKTISEAGELSGVVVSSSGKFASAHDLRRTFGLRWAQSGKVTPAELQQLMRHASIQTTMAFYALVDASAFAEKLWQQTTTHRLNMEADPENNKLRNS